MIWANSCLSKLHQYLSHENLGGFGFVEDAFHGTDISFNEAIGFMMVQT